MPYLSVQISGQPDDSLAQRVSHELTTLTAEILGKDPQLTAIAVSFVAESRWFVGTKPIAQLGQRTFFVSVTVTDETNTKSEKARYIAAVFDRMGQSLGGISDKSYVHVMDARASAYGYGGRTQERRYVEATHLLT